MKKVFNLSGEQEKNIVDAIRAMSVKQSDMEVLSLLMNKYRGEELKFAMYYAGAYSAFKSFVSVIEMTFGFKMSPEI